MAILSNNKAYKLQRTIDIVYFDILMDYIDKRDGKFIKYYKICSFLIYSYITYINNVLPLIISGMVISFIINFNIPDHTIQMAIISAIAISSILIILIFNILISIYIEKMFSKVLMSVFIGKDLPWDILDRYL